MTGSNRLLAELPADERRCLQPALELVQLPKGKVVYDSGDLVRYVYLPLNGMVSLVAMTHDGDSLQVAVVGSDGLIGVPIVLQEETTPYQAVVQISSEAYRVRAITARAELMRNPGFQRAALQYAHRQMAQIGEAAVCRSCHTVTQRLARWLLIWARCLRSDSIELTQEHMAHMLGSRRTAVSTAAVELQDKALIRQRRGRMQILNRKGLEASACECDQASQIHVTAVTRP